jgi:hypothetical protein
VRIDVVGEHVECASHQAHDAIGMATRPAADNDVAATTQAIERCSISSPEGESSQVVGDRRKSKEARAALPRTLTGHETGDARCLADTTRVDREGDEDTSTHGRADIGERSWRKSDVCVRSREPCAAITTDQDGLNSPDRPR